MTFFRTLSRFAGGLRFAFMPLGLAALVAVGVHAAADTLDDRLLWGLDRVDAAADAFFASFDLTASLVDLVGGPERTRVARGVMLVWELVADLVLMLPMLGYAEEDAASTSGRFATKAGWRELFRIAARKPGTMRITRPLFVGAVSIAGACTLAQLVQSTATLGLGNGLAGRGLAVATLLGVLASFATRAVLRSFEDAHVRTEAAAQSAAARLRLGLIGSIIAAPLAAAAILDASPLLAFLV